MDDQIFDSETRSEIPTEAPRRSWLKSYAVWIALVLAVLLIGGIFWYFLSSHTAVQPQSNNVVLIMKGPAQITSDNEAEYTIIYRNGENADLVNLSMNVFYPSGFTFKSATPDATSAAGTSFNLPPVKAGQSGQLVIRGTLSGSTGEDKEIQARLQYELSNFNSDFVVQQSIHTSILPPNLTMNISGPTNVVNGQDMTFTVNYTNVTAQDYSDLGMQLTYPAGFTFTSATIPGQQNNTYWTLPKLPSGGSATLEITGSFTGDNGSDQLVRADLGQVVNGNFAPQIDSTATFQIIPSSLSISIKAQPTGYVKLGDSINYTLDYSNQGNIGLNNAVIVVKLTGPALDYSKISSSDGIIAGQTITWKAASRPSLAILSPSEGGEITFSVPVVQALASNLKNQSIVASASIMSDEITAPTKAPDLTLKLISSLTLQVDGQYVSGAAPMQVGKPTVFAITFLLSNLSNDLSGTQVMASMPLPPGSWNNVIIPASEAGQISYDPNSGNVKWTLGDFPAFTGKYTPAAKITFQIQVTPTATDSGKTETLLTNVQATGTDTFVGQTLQSDTTATVDTASIDDDTLDSKGTAVQ